MLVLEQKGTRLQFLKQLRGHARHKVRIELAIVEYGLLLRTEIAQVITIEPDTAIATQRSDCEDGFEQNGERSRSRIRAASSA
jgi:hypothetical protein